MASPVNTIESYRDENGNDYFQQWISSLKDKTGKVAVLGRIKRLEFGNQGNCRDLADGVWEMKIDVGPGYRVYFARAGRTVYIILGAGDKSTQKTDIANAKERWAKYQKASKKK